MLDFCINVVIGVYFGFSIVIFVVVYEVWWFILLNFGGKYGIDLVCVGYFV